MLCPNWETPAFLIFSGDPKIPTLLYYSHVPIIIIVLFGSFLVYRKKPKDLISQVLFALSIAFSLWGFLNLLLWAQNNIAIMTFARSFLIMVEAAFFFLGVYLVSIFPEGKDVSFKRKLIFGAFFIPFLILLPTPYTIEGFRSPGCDAFEGFFMSAYLIYFIEPFAILWMVGTLLLNYLEAHTKKRREQFLFTLFGLGGLFTVFWLSRIMVRFLGEYQFSEYGFLGIIAFVGIIVYLITRYQLFNIRVFAGEVLTVVLFILIASQFFLVTSVISRGIILTTLIIVAAFGIFLIRSTKQEARRKADLERFTKELQQANERLVELDKMKSQVFSLASYQLRTPITSIRGFAYLITGEYEKLSPDKVKEMVWRIRRSSDKMLATINEFLMWRRLEEGKMEYVYAETDIVKVVKDLVEEIRLIAEGKGLLLTVVSPPDPIMVTMDGQRITQALQNIMDNALRYTDTGWIRISVRQAEKAVIIVVHDSGRGIAPDDIQKVFKGFARSDHAMDPTQGAGIGLFVSRRIIEEGHKGKIQVESGGLGRGSTFTIELPV